MMGIKTGVFHPLIQVSLEDLVPRVLRWPAVRSDPNAASGAIGSHTYDNTCIRAAGCATKPAESAATRRPASTPDTRHPGSGCR
jgi:hypothetical protein